ncbi:hypothetical protein M0R72_11340 [Candidatus Pacearchaeota archaeon]|jgi:ATP-dependent protease HslVU (ClpYQ) peptidase subunit|nr:hypothetical protein [Candidatus Pacearchaeota archaeon]
MTCIVGLKQGNTVFMGCDSAGVGGLNLRVRADRKVFQKDGFIIGFTSSFRMGELLQHSIRIPVHHLETDIYAYMVTSFIDAVRECLKAGGYAAKDKEVETAGNFLVGYKGRLFNIGGDYQVGEALLPYDACGCGENYALGALYANNHLPPEERITQALMAAQEFSAGVRAPFYVLSEVYDG